MNFQTKMWLGSLLMIKNVSPSGLHDNYDLHVPNDLAPTLMKQTLGKWPEKTAQWYLGT